MSTTSSAQSPSSVISIPRIKHTTSGMAAAAAASNPQRLTGKHPPGGPSSSVYGRPSAGSNTRPQALANGVGGGSNSGGAAAASATGTGTTTATSKLAERKRAAANKAAELARQRPKANGVTITPAEEPDGNSVVARQARERVVAIEVCGSAEHAPPPVVGIFAEGSCR